MHPSYESNLGHLVRTWSGKQEEVVGKESTDPHGCRGLLYAPPSAGKAKS